MKHLTITFILVLCVLQSANANGNTIYVHVNAASIGDNDPDVNINLGCLPSATVSGSLQDGAGQGLPTDILWDPSTGVFKTESSLHAYGMAANTTMGGVTREYPFWWMVEWPEAKNINYITAGGSNGEQSQLTTEWAIQIWNDTTETWFALPKAHNGWKGDTLSGVGGWVDDGLLHWRGLEPVVTKKLRIIAYAAEDSLRSFVLTGRTGDVNSTLIQYLDYSGMVADNEMDEMVNLGLLDECVVSAVFKADELWNIRGEPDELLFDPVKGDFNVTTTRWAEFGYPYGFDAGMVPVDTPFYWMCEWPAPKKINYFTWGGAYG
ncbi:hypothetical protein ACFL45_05860 [Candidatus Neomarinimicrobiota bacterium]